MANDVKQDKMLCIKQSDAQAILNYLGTRPCAEVYSFVSTMLALKDVAAEVPPAPPAEPPPAEPPAEALPTE